MHPFYVFCNTFRKLSYTLVDAEESFYRPHTISPQVVHTHTLVYALSISSSDTFALWVMWDIHQIHCFKFLFYLFVGSRIFDIFYNMPAMHLHLIHRIVTESTFVWIKLTLQGQFEYMYRCQFFFGRIYNFQHDCKLGITITIPQFLGKMSIWYCQIGR